jgi:hypothetical protein
METEVKKARVEVIDPRKRFVEDAIKIRKRLKMLREQGDRLPGIIEAMERTLPEHLAAKVELQAVISWDNTAYVDCELDIRNVISWSDVENLLAFLDAIGYAADKWTSFDEPNEGRRKYVWEESSRAPFRISIYAVLDEEKTICKRVLVRVEHHSGHSFSQEVYAFDCGLGAEETIRRANEAKAA